MLCIWHVEICNALEPWNLVDGLNLHPTVVAHHVNFILCYVDSIARIKFVGYGFALPCFRI